jgi:biopolymer transport protein ExbD
MAFGTQDGNFADSGDEVMNEINMTPLVDVMLVLLIIFIITVPVMKHAVNIDLPRATNQPQDVKPQTLRLSVDASGQYFLNEQPTSDDAVVTQLQNAARQEPQPELHIRGDKAVRYERVAQAMAVAQQAGVRKIGFITEPKANP